MDLIQAVVLGIVQGLTEFLPISSSGHVLLVPAVFGWEDSGAGFTAVIQIGTLLAVLIYFWRDLVEVSRGWVAGLREPAERKKSGYRLGWAIVVGSIPIGVLGLLFENAIDTNFRSSMLVAAMLVAGAILMGLGELLGKRTKEIGDVKMTDGWWVGIFQALALIPGTSRSGSTIAGAMLLGFNRADAARFSFLLMVPAVAASGVYKLYSDAPELLGDELMPVVVATVFSFLSGYGAIAFLMRFLQTHSLLVFIVYRLLLAGVIALLVWQGVVAR